MHPVLPVSVVIPTIGRARQLAACLRSLAACATAPAEVVVVDQGGLSDVAQTVARFEHYGARLVHCAGIGRGRGVNAGLREAKHEIVLVTDDDCTVSPSWIDVAWQQVTCTGKLAIITGRVLPAGDPRAVPSTIDDPQPREFGSPLDCGRLYAGNMACLRSPVLELGGFDERIRPAAEDVELCYRWLRAGHALRYEPDLVVWHHDWRTTEELEELYVAYARGVGAFYAKHLRLRDPIILRLLARDVHGGLRGLAARLLRGRPRWSDSRQGILRGLPAGLRDGWRTFAPRGEDSAAPGDALRIDSR
jgi:GT2 family glycosyltransferase